MLPSPPRTGRGIEGEVSSLAHLPATRIHLPAIPADSQATGTDTAETAAYITEIGTYMKEIAGYNTETRIPFMEATPDWSKIATDTSETGNYRKEMAGNALETSPAVEKGPSVAGFRQAIVRKSTRYECSLESSLFFGRTILGRVQGRSAAPPSRLPSACGVDSGDDGLLF